MSESSVRILVVEDDAIDMRLILAMLEEFDCDVTTVPDGERAVAISRIEVFDIVLMDLDMPNMDGLEATREIRAGATPMRDVRIVALTAYHDTTTRRACIEAGMNAFLPKPIVTSALEIVLSPHCAMARPDPDTIATAPPPGGRRTIPSTPSIRERRR